MIKDIIMTKLRQTAMVMEKKKLMDMIMEVGKEMITEMMDMDMGMITLRSKMAKVIQITRQKIQIK